MVILHFCHFFYFYSPEFCKNKLPITSFQNMLVSQPPPEVMQEHIDWIAQICYSYFFPSLPRREPSVLTHVLLTGPQLDFLLLIFRYNLHSVIQLSLLAALLSDTKGCFRSVWYTSWPRPRASCFSKEPQFMLVGKNIQI